ncbi:MAG: metallophosphoesterase [Fulvivirga sp.]
MANFNNILILLLFIILPSCFEYNPNQIILEDNEKDLTSKNITKIKSSKAPAVIRFVLMGDTQRFYDESDEFVKRVNQLEDITFVIHAGDISDFGLTQEFQWIHDIMSKIKFPYLTVIGNHDLLANGSKVYARMYGDFNYSFDYGNYKFIMLNTNSREYGFKGNVPDLAWLQEQLDTNTAEKEIIIFSHIPPFDEDFDKNLEQAYANMLAKDPHVHLSMHGHRHSFMDEEYYNDGVRYFVTTSMEKKGYALVTLAPEKMEIEIINY